MVSKEVTIGNATGLHARPAQKFVQLAGKFQSQIQIYKNNESKTDAKSILGLMSLALEKGTTITIEATGDDEQEAVDQLIELINNFGDE